MNLASPFLFVCHPYGSRYSTCRQIDIFSAVVRGNNHSSKYVHFCVANGHTIRYWLDFAVIGDFTDMRSLIYYGNSFNRHNSSK